MQLDALFKQPQALPAVPKVVHELIDSFNAEDVSIEAISKKIAADPVLSARLLRLANSAYYHVSRTVGSVDDAVMMLGFVTVRTLVISSGLTGSFKSMPGVDLSKFWRYSLQTGVVSRWIARTQGHNAEVAFTVGLMHGIGQLVMHAGMPEQMLQLDRQVDLLDAGRFEAEQAALGYHFGVVSAELARQWRFPVIFAESIAQFADPAAHTPFAPIAGVLHLAAWRARGEQQGLSSEALAASVPTQVCALLKIDPAELLRDMPPMAELTEGMEALLG